MTEELQTYKKNVFTCAEKGIHYLFHNKGNAHALTICSSMFQNARNVIRIAARQLYNDEVVNQPDYIESMRSFLDRKGTRLQIIISRKPTREQVGCGPSFYKMLYEHPAYRDGRVEIRDSECKYILYKGKKVNFCTADDRMYRLETDIFQRQAVADFCDIDSTKTLNSLFDRIFVKLTSKVELKEYFAS